MQNLITPLLASAILAGGANAQRPSQHSPFPPPSQALTRSPTTSRVEVQGGVPTLIINSQAAAPTSLKVYNQESTANIGYDTSNWLPKFKGYVDKVKAASLTYLSFNIYLHSAMFRTPTEPAVYGSELNFANMDQLFDYAQEQGIYLMPAIRTTSPPEWWWQQHRTDEIQLGYDQVGKPNMPPTKIDFVGASYNNPEYWAVMDEYIKTIVNRYKSHPALLGWQPSVGISGENNYGPSYIAGVVGNRENASDAWGDYSPFAKRRFRSWLSARYGTDAALQQAWGEPLVTLAAAEPPAPQGLPAALRATLGNSPGDARVSMSDWLEFRLEEKGADWKHFTDLVKSLDPDHVVAMCPGGAMTGPVGATARSGTVDGGQWTRYRNVDLLMRYPRLSYYESGSGNNEENYQLFAYIAYTRRLGKIATFSFEDLGDSDIQGPQGPRIESLERIRSVAPMIAAAGGGMGWVTEASRATGDGSGLLSWGDNELREIAAYAHLFDPANRSVKVPKIAILLDAKGGQVEYALGGVMGTDSRDKDRRDFIRVLYEAGIEMDPIEPEEVGVDPAILDSYEGVVLANMARLGATVAQIVEEYGRRGGGLFVGGRTGVFDGAGRNAHGALRALLGLSSLPTTDAVAYARWSFDSGSDSLLAGVAGQQADGRNHYYVPVADWASEGYRELAHAGAGARPATLLAKNKTVVWFPRLATDNADLLTRFFENWMALIGTAPRAERGRQSGPARGVGR